MVTLYFANLGAGKTTLLARIVSKELKRMKKNKSKYDYIVSNALISGVRFESDIRNILRTHALKNCLILIDEASIIYNNRKLKMTDNEIQYFKLSRHYNSDIVVVSQSYEDVDITLRRIYSAMYLLNKLPFGLTLIRPIRRKVAIDEQTKTIIDAYYFRMFLFWRLLYRPRYYHMFDTHWIPEDIPIKKVSELKYLPISIRKKIHVRIYNKFRLVYFKLKRLVFHHKLLLNKIPSYKE